MLHPGMVRQRHLKRWLARQTNTILTHPSDGSYTFARKASVIPGGFGNRTIRTILDLQPHYSCRAERGSRNGRPDALRSGPARARGEQAQGSCALDRCAPLVHAEFGVQLAHMRLHGVNGYVELAGNLGCREVRRQIT
jgi:hypothetical protein